MSEPEFISSVLVRSIARCDNNLSGRIMQMEVFRRWNEIASNISRQTVPIKINKKTLTIYSNNPAVKDTLKFLANSLIEKINTLIGQGEIIVNKIALAKTFEKPSEDIEEYFNPKFDKKVTEKKFSPEDLKKINLTDEEIADCEKFVSVIEDENYRQDLLKTFLIRAKLKKWRLKNGWHKCKTCEELCEPKEILCDLCKIYEREKMRKKIHRIFFDLPWKKFLDVQKEICAEMPHMTKECTLADIQSVWSEMVRETASRISFGDKKSLDAKFLVMLYKHVDEKKLTARLIDRTLNELRFNLADQPSVNEKNNSQPKKVL